MATSTKEGPVGPLVRRALAFWEQDALRKRVLRGTSWSFASAAISQGALLIVSVVTARILGVSGFGELAIINSTVGLFGVFAGFGLGMTATKYVAQFRRTDPVRAGRIVALTVLATAAVGGAASVALLLFAQPLASRALSAPHLVFEMRIASLLLFFNALNGAQTGAICGLENFRSLALVNLAKGLISVPLSVAGALYWGLPGSVGALSVAAALGCAANQWALQRGCHGAGIPIDFSSAAQEMNVIWDFSLPAFMASAMATPAMWAANAMLVNAPSGFAELGIFNAAFQWRTALMFLPNLVAQVAVPILASLQGLGDDRPAQRILLTSIAANAAVTVPVLALLLPSARWIMSLYGPTFSSRQTVFQIMIVAAGLLAVQAPVGSFIAAYGRMWIGFFMNMAWATCMCLTAYVLLERGWGAEGVASAHLVAYIGHALWTFWFAASVLKPRPSVLAHPNAIEVKDNHVSL